MKVLQGRVQIVGIPAGTITVEELRDALATMDRKLPADEVANLLQDVDMNDSGAIDYEEFLAATLHASKIATDEHLKRAFQEFDADNSGVHFLLCSLEEHLM